MSPRPIAKQLALIAAVVTLSIGVTAAYFTSATQSADNVFTMGSLAISIDQHTQLMISDVLPGDTHLIEFQLENTGTTPVHAKGYVAGTAQPAMSLDGVQITAVERYHGGEWYPLLSEGSQLGDEFFLTNQGDSELLVLEPASQEKLRARVLFATSIGDELQKEQIALNLHAAARQVTQGADWPAEY